MGNKNGKYHISSDSHPDEDEDVDNGESQSKVRSRNAIIFCILGLLVFTVLFLGMSAAQDILAGTFIPTSSILLCTSIPFFLVTLLAPYVIQFVSPTVRVISMAVLATTGVWMVSLGESISVKLTGICLIALGSGIAETCFLSLTAFFDQTAISAYCGGTGSGFAFGPLYYTALTTWFCVPARTALMTVVGVPVVILLLYSFLKKPASLKTTKKETTVHTELLSVYEPEQQQYTWKEKIMTLKRTLLLALSLIAGVSFEYLTVQAVVTTLAFPNSLFSPRDHYQFYFFTFATGELIGRSYSLVTYYCCNSFVALTEKTWIFTCIMGANLLFTIFASWYRFLPSIWPVLFVLFEHGAISGALYVNTFGMAGKHETDVRGKEFSRAFATIGSGMGLTIAGFVGLILEPYLRNHCLSSASVANDEFCFTRKDHGFNSTSLC